MLKCCYVISKFNSHAGNTVTLLVTNNRLHRLKSTRNARTENVLIAGVINFFLIGIVKEVQA